MSVLIKGMEMPTSCWECPFQDCGNCTLNAHKAVDRGIIEDCIDEDCPLVPVPPHGRLIDADALAKKMRGIVFRGEEKDVLHHNVQAFLDAPTIIPADKEDKDGT